MLRDYIIALKAVRIVGRDFFKSIGGFKVLRIWRRWNLYYAGLMAKAAAECGWDPKEPSDDPVWQALSAVYAYFRKFPEKPPREALPSLAPLLAILRWALEHICERNIPDAPAKYAEFLRTPLYRAYRQALYRYFLAPLAGRIETVLVVGGGLVEPFDIIEVVNQLRLPLQITVQEVNPDAAKALAAAGFDVVLGELSQVEVEKPFDLVTVQAVLHWADDPLKVLAHAAELGRYVLVSQPFGPHQAAIMIATTLMGAKRYIHDWREVEGWARQAGLAPVKSGPLKRSLKGGFYIRFYQTKWLEKNR